MLRPKFAESARIANVSRSRPMIVKLKFDCANRDRFLYLYMRTTWFFGGKASPKPAIANADERASSVTSLVNAPLRQTYPLQLSRVIASSLMAAAAAEEILPPIPPVQVARSVNCPRSTSPPLITSPCITATVSFSASICFSSRDFTTLTLNRPMLLSNFANS